MSKKESLTFSDIEQSLRLNPALKDPMDQRDYSFIETANNVVGAIDLPKMYSLRAKCSPVKNQGSRGTCVGFGSTGVSEFFNRAEMDDKFLNLSEEFLFRKIKDIDIKDYNYSGYGAYIRSGAKALRGFGTCPESRLPYNFYGSEDSWKNVEITPVMEAEAKLFRVKNYFSVACNKEEIKKALVVSKGPLIAAFSLYESYRQAKKNGGFILVPKAKEKKIGGHCMEIVGYNDKYMELKNSWGSAWGNNGYIWWPWEALDKVSSIWSFIDLENPEMQKHFIALQKGQTKFSFKKILKKIWKSKRIRSLIWRAAMMFLGIVTAIAANMLLDLQIERSSWKASLVLFWGLVLGEVSKAINNKYQGKDTI
jgi:C1A family cysteine protease